DANGIYVALYATSAGSMTIFAIDKAPLIAASPSLGTVTSFAGLGFEGAIQPCQTLPGASPPGEYFVSRAGSNSIRLRRVNPPLTGPTMTEVGFFPVAANSPPPLVPALNTAVNLDSIDARLMNAVYRAGFIYTAHTIS